MKTKDIEKNVLEHEIERVNGDVVIKLMVECPYCSIKFNALQEKQREFIDKVYSDDKIFNGYDEIVKCPVCKKDMSIDRVCFED